jgi:hypothetical protein
MGHTACILIGSQAQNLDATYCNTEDGTFVLSGKGNDLTIEILRSVFSSNASESFESFSQIPDTTVLVKMI